MRTRSAVFRCDASEQIGGGHVMRCLALADALSQCEWTCHFRVGARTPAIVPAINGYPYTIVDSLLENGDRDERADLLVVDNYSLDASYETAARAWAAHIFAIDDLANRPHDCDFLLDQNLGRIAGDYEHLAPSCRRLLLGPEYALLRPEFRALRAQALQRRANAEVTRVLISCGASDPNRFGEKVADALLARDPSFVVDLVLGRSLASDNRRGPVADGRIMVYRDVHDMARLMVAVDLAVGGAGVMAWERCALGLPSILIDMSENQSRNAKALAALGAARIATENEMFEADHVAAEVIALADDCVSLRAMSKAAAAIVDGCGLDRVVAVVNGLQ